MKDRNAELVNMISVVEKRMKKNTEQISATSVYGELVESIEKTESELGEK